MWPFETVPVLPPRPASEARVMHAETYLSIVPFQVDPGQMREEEQAQVVAQATVIADPARAAPAPCPTCYPESG